MRIKVTISIDSMWGDIQDEITVPDDAPNATIDNIARELALSHLEYDWAILAPAVQEEGA
jgi:hypothetical protein